MQEQNAADLFAEMIKRKVISYGCHYTQEGLDHTIAREDAPVEYRQNKYRAALESLVQFRRRGYVIERGLGSVRIRGLYSSS